MRIPVVLNLVWRTLIIRRARIDRHCCGIGVSSNREIIYRTVFLLGLEDLRLLLSFGCRYVRKLFRLGKIDFELLLLQLSFHSLIHQLRAKLSTPMTGRNNLNWPVQWIFLGHKHLWGCSFHPSWLLVFVNDWPFVPKFVGIFDFQNCRG